MKNGILLFVFGFVFSQVLAQTNTWNGSTDNDWHKSCNWSLDAIPTAAHDVVIPTVTPYPTITSNAHCKTISITTTAANALTLNSTGGGTLCISSTNSGACSTGLTDNGGCTISSTELTVNGTYNAFFTYDCVGITPYSNTSRNILIFNNTSFSITFNFPNFGCADQNPAPGNYTLASGSTLNFWVQSGVGTSAPNCCVTNFTRTVTWTSTDGGSGSFIVETGNNL